MRCSTSRSTCIGAPPWPASSATKRGTIRRADSWAAMKWRRCRWACPSWPRSSIRAPGDVLFPREWKAYRGWPECGWAGGNMPQETNRVTLDPKAKDKFGLPVASVHYDDHPNDVAMRNHAYKQGAAVYEAVGATVTYPTTPYPSTHNLGTNRMSAKARDGVVNKFGQTHDIKNLFVSDGSQFTSGAACNPTLTIVSLAIRQADHIAGAMQRKEI